MPRIRFTPSFFAEIIGGAEVLEVDAGSLFQMLRAMEAQFPGLGDFCETRATFAVDGVLTSDWAAPLDPGAEVLVVPRIGGG